MTFSLDVPVGPLAEAALTVARSSESASVANHSLRSFFFAELLAAREGCRQDAAYDRDLLFAATVMHDLGVGSLAKGEARFEVEGADLAAAVLREHGVAEPDADRVWEAIALHTSPGIAERRGLLAYLTREGIGIDFGRRGEIVSAWAPRIHAAYPRLAMARSLVEAIVERAARSPAAAPRYSIGGELLREREANGITGMELAAASSPWGE
jgi:hypothetical protein